MPRFSPAAVAPLVVFAALAGLLGFYLLTRPPAGTVSAEGRMLPAFALPPVSPDAPGFSRADLPAEPALINFFASWCAPCAVEHPVLTDIAAEGVPLYGVAWLDHPGAAAAWLEKRGNPFRRVGEDTSGQLGANLSLTGAPETFLVDAEGRVRRHIVGMITRRMWEDDLRPAYEALKTTDKASD